jgi:threonine synthase
MRYVSTRGKAPALGFEDALLAGLAADGGLYLPEFWPTLSMEGLRDLPYHEVALRVVAPFIGDEIPREALARMVREAYAVFDHPDVAPLVELERGVYLLELFHGPTLSFKDYALQLVGRLFDHALSRRGERVTVIGATSGDTGSAAIESLRDRKAVDVFILYPKGRVSEVQRRQMTTVDASNIHNIAIEGHFDDCQDLVKAMFADARYRAELRLSAVNSINWARVICQAVFYVRACAKLGGKVAFAVPTGNFGNVFAGWVARRIGAPVDRLIIGSNRNDILTRFLETGVMQMHEVVPTLSPAMDIQVSSNFERLLFEAWNRDAARVAGAMEAFRKGGEYAVDRKTMESIRAVFDGERLDDEGTKRVIRAVHAATGKVVDPHTAVGIHAGRAKRRDTSVPLVCIATAHPAKFPEAVEAATGKRPEMPPRLADLFSRPERLATLPNDVAQVKEYIRAQVAMKGAA